MGLTILDPPSRRLATGPAAAPPPRRAGRLASIDALRGFAIFCIVGFEGVVTSVHDAARDHPTALGRAAGSIGRQFTHSAWQGLSFYDVIFPLFLILAGVAIPLSLPRLVEREGRGGAFLYAAKRAGLLVALGILCNGGLSEPWPDVRLPGILQRIAVCYLAAAGLFLVLDWRGLAAACAALLAGYWALLALVPVPGHGVTGTAEAMNLTIWADQMFLPGKMHFGTWDPEGLLSTLGAAASCLMGVLAGLMLTRATVPARETALRIAAAGAGLVALGLLGSLAMPIVKWIWTPTYALVTGGICLVLIGVLHRLVDVERIDGWTPVLLWLGTNAVAIYVLNEVVDFSSVAELFVGGDVSRIVGERLGENASRAVTHLGALALAILLARFLYKRGIFLKV